MLKIDRVSLKGNLKASELANLSGVAKVKAGSAPEVEGRFRMLNCGMSTMCAIEAALVSVEGEAPNQKAKSIILDAPSDFKVTLRGTFERKVYLEAGAAKFDSGLSASDLPATAPAEGEEPAVAVVMCGKDVTVPLAAAADVDPVTKTVLLPVPAGVQFDRDKFVTVKITMDVGEAAASAPNASHKIMLMPDNDDGVLHFSILANADVPAGKKPNKTLFEVRGARPWKTLGGDSCVKLVAPPAPDKDHPVTSSEPENP